MTYITTKEFTSEMIRQQTIEFEKNGGIISKIPRSKTQESYVFNRIPRKVLRD